MNELPVELHGGPRDGDVLMVRPGWDGLPLPLLRLPRFQGLAAIDPDADHPGAEIAYSVCVYYRGVISEDTHRWMYRLGGCG